MADEPVKIYHCESCPKTFVRSDLLFRHKDRHAKKTTRRTSSSGSRYKSIRPARSDSTSSREDSTMSQPLPCDAGPSTNALQINGNSPRSAQTHFGLPLSLSHHHPSGHISYGPTSSPQNTGPSSSFEEYAVHHRTNTLPTTIPIMQASHQSPNFDNAVHHPHSISPILPPIRSNHALKSRTYSVESILNEMETKGCSAVRDSAIEE